LFQSWQLFICSRTRVLLILRSPAHFHNYQDLTNQMAAFRPSTGSARAFKLMLVIIEYTGVRVRSSKCQSSKRFGYWSKRIKFRDYKNIDANIEQRLDQTNGNWNQSSALKDNQNLKLEKFGDWNQNSNSRKLEI